MNNKMKIIGEASKTGKCPTCGGKYLLATNYCVSCKKKIKKEKKKESRVPWSKIRSIAGESVSAYVVKDTLEMISNGQSPQVAFEVACENENLYGTKDYIVKLRKEAANILHKNFGYSVSAAFYESKNLKESLINPFIELISEAIYESLRFYPDGMFIKDWKDNTYSSGDIKTFSVRSSNEILFNCENPNTGELLDGNVSVLLITKYDEREKIFITKTSITGIVGKERFSN